MFTLHITFKFFQVSVAAANITSVIMLFLIPYLFTYLLLNMFSIVYHKLVKFEQNRMMRMIQNLKLFFTKSRLPC